MSGRPKPEKAKKNSHSDIDRKSQCYGFPVCPACGSRMLTFVYIVGTQQMDVGCSVCKRQMKDDEFEEVERRFWG